MKNKNNIIKAILVMSACASMHCPPRESQTARAPHRFELRLADQISQDLGQPVSVDEAMFLMGLLKEPPAVDPERLEMLTLKFKEVEDELDKKYQEAEEQKPTIHDFFGIDPNMELQDMPQGLERLKFKSTRVIVDDLVLNMTLSGYEFKLEDQTLENSLSFYVTCDRKCDIRIPKELDARYLPLILMSPQVVGVRLTLSSTRGDKFPESPFRGPTQLAAMMRQLQDFIAYLDKEQALIKKTEEEKRRRDKLEEKYGSRNIGVELDGFSGPCGSFKDIPAKMTVGEFMMEHVRKELGISEENHLKLLHDLNILPSHISLYWLLPDEIDGKYVLRLTMVDTNIWHELTSCKDFEFLADGGAMVPDDLAGRVMKDILSVVIKHDGDEIGRFNVDVKNLRQHAEPVDLKRLLCDLKDQGKAILKILEKQYVTEYPRAKLSFAYNIVNGESEIRLVESDHVATMLDFTGKLNKLDPETKDAVITYIRNRAFEEVCKYHMKPKKKAPTGTSNPIAD